MSDRDPQGYSELWVGQYRRADVVEHCRVCGSQNLQVEVITQFPGGGKSIRIENVAPGGGLDLQQRDYPGDHWCGDCGVMYKARDPLVHGL